MRSKINSEKILITRTDKIGDVILTLPLISETKRLFPESKISFFTSKIMKDLLLGYKDIDEIFFYEDYPGFFNKLRFLKSKKFDVVINVFPRFELALLFFISGIKIRVGTAYRGYSILYNKKLYEHRKDAVKHESDYNLNLLTLISDKVEYNKIFNFKYTDAEKLNLENKFIKFNFSLNDKFIIIHPCSKGSAQDWSLDNFKLYINIFINTFPNYKIILTGTDEEIKRIEYLTAQNSNNILNLCGFLNLKELMILIDNSKLFISNSTGPLHIAGALNKNIIAFFPNRIPINEKRWRPLSKNAVILKPDNSEDDVNSIKVENVILETKKFC